MYTHYVTHTQTCTQLPYWPQNLYWLCPWILIRKYWKWPHPSHLPTVLLDFVSVLGRQQHYRSQLPATLRVKSIFHKQGQRARAGREYKQHLWRGTRQLRERSRGGWEGIIKTPAGLGEAGVQGRVESQPWVESIGGGTQQESPAPPEASPSTPTPSQRDKGAIEGLRQGWMPRGCRILIKHRERSTMPAPLLFREDGENPGTPGLRLKKVGWVLNGTVITVTLLAPPTPVLRPLSLPAGSVYISRSQGLNLGPATVGEAQVVSPTPTLGKGPWLCQTQADIWSKGRRTTGL